MKNYYLILLAIFFAACASEPEQKKTEEKRTKKEYKIKIKDIPGFTIEQKKDYINPEFDIADMRKAVNPGPHNGKTFIDDPDIAVLDDLTKLYKLPDGWKFAIAKYKRTKVKQPVIVTSDEKLISFIIEDNFLMYDTKIITEKNGKKYIEWKTEEIPKTR